MEKFNLTIFRALGLIENLTDDELAMGRLYVRFSDEEMSTADVRW